MYLNYKGERRLGSCSTSPVSLLGGNGGCDDRSSQGVLLHMRLYLGNRRYLSLQRRRDRANGGHRNTLSWRSDDIPILIAGHPFPTGGEEFP